MSNVVTYTVVLAAPNPEQLLLPGMTALVDIVVQQSEDALKLPNAALRFQPPPETNRFGEAIAATPRGTSGNSAPTVWVLGEDNRAMPVSVRLGISNGSMTAAVGGALREGQKVIVGVAPAAKTSGLFGLRLGF